MNSDGHSFTDAVYQDFADLGDGSRLAHIALRLVIAALLGGVLGYQRELVGKAAGLRTHMLVSVGSAFFVMVPQLEGMALGDMSRVLQGIITGIGFLAGGAILKLTSEKEIQGLTTAAGIWLATAIGIAVGFGRLGTAIVGAVFAFLILGAVQRAQARWLPEHKKENE
jgi:putative Mg2+ transporter-C (MgtC) family protein